MSLGVVIVTFNRIEMLKKALYLFETQSKLPSYILVVNNASTDSTREYLDEWMQIEIPGLSKFVVHCENNTGGSGGFYTALSEALNLDADWIWVSDDDAFPEKNTLECAYRYINRYNNNVAVCAKVLNNGKIDRAHRRRIKRGLFHLTEEFVEEIEYDNDYFELDEFSYVGVIINKNILSEVGVTNKDFFINQDDTEHSLRIRKKGKIVCVPTIVVNHDVGRPEKGTVNWKRYYEIRNRYFTYKNNYPARYCKVFYAETKIKYYIKKIFRLVSNDELNMYRAALKDIKTGKLGMHEIYRPGWKFSN